MKQEKVEKDNVVSFFNVYIHSRMNKYATCMMGEVTNASDRWGPGGMVTRWLDVPSFPLMVSVINNILLIYYSYMHMYKIKILC